MMVWAAQSAGAQSPAPGTAPRSLAKVLTNHIGYEPLGPKKAVVLTDGHVGVTAFRLLDAATGKTLYRGAPRFSGPVNHWKHWQFWTIDFTPFTTEGNYILHVTLPGGSVSSYPFAIEKNVLERETVSDVIYYFKGQRCSGLLDKADRSLPVPGNGDAGGNTAAPAGDTSAAIDVHGGWYDATGDYGKHLSHLSFSAYFNPQQIPLAAWSLLKTNELLSKRPGTDFRQYCRRLSDEALFGVDYLVRVKVPGGSFYRSVNAPGPGKLPGDRRLGAEEKSYRIKANKDQSWSAGGEKPAGPESYESSYRSGAGMAIAALAIASTSPVCGDFTQSDYLKAAEDAFAFLERENLRLTSDGRENIIDDYCALNAASELYKATHKPKYQAAAERRANRLLDRLSTWGKYSGYWRADDKDRPFFHPSDAGMPVVSLLCYYPAAAPALQARIRQAVRTSMEHELSITREVNNPFGYSRQLVQDTLGTRRSAFFFPHGSEASPWWQGENARLGSMATAARMAAALFAEEPGLRDSLNAFALDQLNWILGENPFDACMLEGKGHNNPEYGFFGTFEYTNAPGGIVNGITSGLNDESDIDFNIPYKVTGKDYDWRWAEQWLPHDSWYLLAVATGGAYPDPEHINDHPTLSIGAHAPAFRLPGIDGRTYTLNNFKDAVVLVVVFICNHCPTSQAYEQRIIRLTSDYAPKGVRVVAINPNHPSALRLDELGYSDLGDSYPEMKIRARKAGYNFPYLYDGDQELAAQAYGPVSTPHVFIFDKDRILRYEGRIDDMEDPRKTPHSLDARNAIDAILAGQPVAVAVTPTFGCSIKWKEKTVWKQKVEVTWAKEPVHLDTIGVDGVRTLLENHTDKLRLINVWATWCVPCVQEFSDLVTLNRMYRDRGFQLVSISTDDTAQAARALAFLEKKESSSPNYIYTGDSKYALIDAIDPNWKGALPYSILVDPGGKVVYAHQGGIDPEVLKKIIFDDPNMGRIYK